MLVVSESSLWRDDMAELLKAEGYAVRVDERGEAALEPGCPFDVAVVDLAMTVGSATAVFAALRARSSIPILAVPPDDYREPAVLEAYAAGVDQFVSKSIRSRELMARIRALLRRTPPRPRESTYAGVAAGSISLDLATGTAILDGKEVVLTPREGEVLFALLERPGRVVTRDKLAATAGGRTTDRALDAVVRAVRTKLESAEGRRRILAVRGVGFRLVPDAELDSRS